MLVDELGNGRSAGLKVESSRLQVSRDGKSSPNLLLMALKSFQTDIFGDLIEVPVVVEKRDIIFQGD